MLLILDSVIGTGLPEADFQGLFVKCRECRAYMTRGTMTFHHCNRDDDSVM